MAQESVHLDMNKEIAALFLSKYPSAEKALEAAWFQPYPVLEEIYKQGNMTGANFEHLFPYCTSARGFWKRLGTSNMDYIRFIIEHNNKTRVENDVATLRMACLNGHFHETKILLDHFLTDKEKFSQLDFLDLGKCSTMRDSVFILHLLELYGLNYHTHFEALLKSCLSVNSAVRCAMHLFCTTGITPTIDHLLLAFKKAFPEVLQGLLELYEITEANRYLSKQQMQNAMEECLCSFHIKLKMLHAKGFVIEDYDSFIAMPPPKEGMRRCYVINDLSQFIASKTNVSEVKEDIQADKPLV